MRQHEMEGDRRGFKGVWLCAAIYESQELSPVEKLLLAEIDALTTDANPSFSTRRQNALFFGLNRPGRRFNKGRGVPKWL
jgi:hypothetical protein